MLIELPPFRNAVALTRESLNTHDVEEITGWLTSNLTGGIYILNMKSRTQITFALPGTDDAVDAACDCIFLFENYNDALHFQMRFIG